MLNIAAVRGREILDSRGRPTVEAEVLLAGGAVGRASVPSGASTGAAEALELRDGEARFGGLGVRRAVAHVGGELAAAVKGLAADEPDVVDQALLAADGTADKSRLGANAILAVSLATARAAAAARDRPLWAHLHETLFPERCASLPLPMINIISGGHHAGFQLDLQDVLIVPLAATDTMTMIETASAVWHAVREILRRDWGYTQLVADEGGFGPALPTNEAALGVVVEGIAAAGYEPGRDIALALDVAASHFRSPAGYRLAAEGFERTPAEMIDALSEWLDKYPVLSLEDPLAEDDWDHWPELTRRLGDQAQIVGDDLFTTNLDRLRRGIAAGAANSILIKVNQIGTLSEAAACCRMAWEAGYTTIVSTRSGETDDAFVADLAVASGAGQFKPGSLARSERLAKFNQLLRLEEELGPERYTGRAAYARWLGA